MHDEGSRMKSEISWSYCLSVDFSFTFWIHSSHVWISLYGYCMTLRLTVGQRIRLPFPADHFQSSSWRRIMYSSCNSYLFLSFKHHTTIQPLFSYKKSVHSSWVKFLSKSKAVGEEVEKSGQSRRQKLHLFASFGFMKRFRDGRREGGDDFFSSSHSGDNFRTPFSLLPYFWSCQSFSPHSDDPSNIFSACLSSWCHPSSWTLFSPLF